MGSERGIMRGLVVSLLMGVCALSTARAEPSISVLSELPRDVSDYRVVDVRAGEVCAKASLPGARCLPIGHFVRPNGDVIGFHALRWLLGTIGLKGSETVLVLGADDQDSRTVAKLLFTAGQDRVFAYAGDVVPQQTTQAGTVRSLSRETVYTAPMRIN